jgi:hypothetical protein
MKKFIGFMIVGIVILAIGLAVGLNLHPGSGSVASAQEGPMIDGQTADGAAFDQQTQDGTLIDGQAQTESDSSKADQVITPTYGVSAATNYRSYAANEFHSTHSNLTYASYGPAIYALAIPGGGFSFKLPLDLPNGAQVTRITVYLVDNDATHNMSIQFYRVTLSNATQYEISSVSTVNLPTSPNVQTVTMVGAPITIIDTTQYTYCIRYAPVIIGNLHQMVGVRVEYQNPAAAFLPLIGK